jgi:hypothetical protein
MLLLCFHVEVERREIISEDNGFGCLGFRIFNDWGIPLYLHKTLDLFGEGEKGEGRGERRVSGVIYLTHT